MTTGRDLTWHGICHGDLSGWHGVRLAHDCSAGDPAIFDCALGRVESTHVGVVRDVTEESHVEAALRQQAARPALIAADGATCVEPTLLGYEYSSY